MSHVQDLARAYGRGKTTAEAVVAAAKAGTIAPSTPAPDGYGGRMARMLTDDGPSYDVEGWDGVTSVYLSGDLSDDQYARLHGLYTA